VPRRADGTVRWGKSPDTPDVICASRCAILPTLSGLTVRRRGQNRARHLRQLKRPRRRFYPPYGVIAAERKAGIDVTGPYGCDTMFHKQGADAFLVMLHDQGHIAAKLQAPNQAAAFAIGSPILFSSVARVSAGP
jgi:hypothetical protein